MKGDWWKLWAGEESTSCIKVSASDYPGYGNNFCFEKDWDTADTAEVIATGVEIGVGIVAGAIAGSASGSTLAYPAYCGASMATATAMSWVLASANANDKWPHGIDQ